MDAERRFASTERAPRRRRRALLLALGAAAGVAIYGYVRVRSSDPDDRLFHPRVRIRVLDQATGAPVAGAIVTASRGSEAVRVWPRERRGPVGTMNVCDVRVGVTDADGAFELEGTAAAEGCDVRVGELPLVSIGIPPTPMRGPADDAVFDSAAVPGGSVYEVARVRVSKGSPDVIRLRPTPWGVVTVRSDTADGPPLGGVNVVRGICEGASASGIVLGTTDATGSVRVLLPTQGALAVHASWQWFPRVDCDATNSGRLSREQPTLAFVAPASPRVRLVGLDASAPGPFRVLVRREGAPVSETRREVFDPGTMSVELSLVSAGAPHELFVDRGEAGGRGVVSGVRAGVDVAPLLRRGEALRVRLTGPAADSASAVLASTTWPERTCRGARDASGALVFSAVPEGSWELRIDTSGDGRGALRPVPVRVNAAPGTLDLDLATLSER